MLSTGTGHALNLIVIPPYPSAIPKRQTWYQIYIMQIPSVSSSELTVSLAP